MTPPFLEISDGKADFSGCRHPIKSLSLIFKVGFLLLLGLSAYLAMFGALLMQT